MEDVICITTRNFEIKFLNCKGRIIFNKTNEPVIGRKCYELLHDTHYPHESCPLEKFIKTGQLNKETTTFFENGHIIKVTPIFDQFGNFSSLLHKITPNIQGKNENKNIQELRRQTIELEIHKFDDFKKRLSMAFPQLTSYNLKHAILIRMNLSTKETARYFNVHPGSIQKARVRLKKKLNLREEESLFNYLFHF
ncbi:MAG: hypothetical protein ACOCYO_11725 [Bacteroidota bacterium]